MGMNCSHGMVWRWWLLAVEKIETGMTLTVFPDYQD